MERREFWISFQQCLGDFDSPIHVVLQTPFFESFTEDLHRGDLITFVHPAKMLNYLVLIAREHCAPCMEDRIALLADHFKAVELDSGSLSIEPPFLMAEKNLAALSAVDAAMSSLF
jgi:hypothetical protein